MKSSKRTSRHSESITSIQLTLSQEAFHAKTFPSQTQTVRDLMDHVLASGKRCLELSARLGHLGLLSKMLLTSKTWDTESSRLTWKVRGMKLKHLIFRLVPSHYNAWNGTYGLLPRPTASDHKGAPMKRYRGSIHSHGNFREVIREKETDGNYPRPEFVEWVKGFPIGWTDLNHSETLSLQESRSKSSKPSKQ